MTYGLSNAVETAVTRSSRGARRTQSTKRYVSADVADRLVEALRHRRAEVMSLTAENDRLRAELNAAREIFMRQRQTNIG